MKFFEVRFKKLKFAFGHLKPKFINKSHTSTSINLTFLVLLLFTLRRKGVFVKSMQKNLQIAEMGFYKR